MFTKMYFATWMVGLLTAAALFVTGNLNPIAQIVFGFLTLGAIFMGMLAVLPFWSEHYNPPKV